MEKIFNEDKSMYKIEKDGEFEFYKNICGKYFLHTKTEKEKIKGYYTTVLDIENFVITDFYQVKDESYLWLHADMDICILMKEGIGSTYIFSIYEKAFNALRDIYRVSLQNA